MPNPRSSHTISKHPLFAAMRCVCFGPSHFRLGPCVPVASSRVLETCLVEMSVSLGQEGEERQEEDPDADAVERRQKLQQLRDELRALRQQRAEVGVP